MSTTTTKLSLSKAQFLCDILKGLQTDPKFLQAKYFYDEQGDYIFQQIMEMDSYYLTNAEMEILSNQSGSIADEITLQGTAFDLIELGAGDATKSIHLLKELISRNLDFTYFPIDISGHVITDLEQRLPNLIPDLKVKGLNGDYFEMLKKTSDLSNRRKVLLFMGANIGNMSVNEAELFCIELKKMLSAGDILIIGFDLKKNPKQILAAYDDPAGITKDFNINLLARINKELNGDFNLKNFEHYASYDPESGSCKSYLISLLDQQVSIGQHATIQFFKNEYIFMEISQKYSLKEIEKLAKNAGFKTQQHFFDEHKYFVDAIWIVE
jgi:L-histidine N-alpha-methyltransferase